jgi:UDP-N-acetylmuramyl tripeptide synthase
VTGGFAPSGVASALAGSLRSVTLRELMGGDAPDVEITGLHYRSSDVRPGGLFFCVPGFKTDGHDFAPDAVERGAAALVCERPLELGVPELVVPSVRAAMGPAAARFYGDPTAKLRVVGITGTNGKTTTAFLTRAILERAGMQTGLLGTVKSIVGGVEEPVERTTPEALDNVLRAARELTDGRVHVVFGAGGDRDRAKRPLMGKAAAELADRVVVTSDNPRSEDPQAIITEILAGTGPDVESEPDRRRAIALAVSSADPGDVVVVAGKGHEQGQEFENGRKEPFDDVAVVREALR